MSREKSITPHWLTRGEVNPDSPWPQQCFAIIPGVTGCATSKIFYLPSLVDYEAMSYDKIFKTISFDIVACRRYDSPGPSYGIGEDGNICVAGTHQDVTDAFMVKQLLKRRHEFLVPTGTLRVTEPFMEYYQKVYTQAPWLYDERPDGRKKSLVPPYFYLDGCVEYVHGVTLQLRKAIETSIDDSRLKELNTEDEMELWRAPRRFTQDLVAFHLGYTVEGFRQALKNEKKELQSSFSIYSTPLK